jgi:hypothetical protein
LRVGGLPEFFFGSAEAEFGEPEPKSLIGFREGLAGNGKFTGQTLAHTGKLRALAGEEESWICHVTKP